MTTAMLELLEAQLGAIPPGYIKHDMEPGFEVMVEWIVKLDHDRRAELMAELPAWLEEVHPWHKRAVLEIGLRLVDRSLLEAAISQARKEGVHDLIEADEYPPWLLFQLELLSAISRGPSDPGVVARAYLQDLRTGASGALSYSRRLLGIRAWFTACRLEPYHRRTGCLSRGLGVLRGWQDARLLRSGLSLLHAYFASTDEGVSELRKVLTSTEFAMACPELVA